MDRERKLLYAVLVMAPIVQAMTFIAWHQMYEQLPATRAAQSETLACQKQLLHAWARCAIENEGCRKGTSSTSRRQ